jgi:hypothetical protein
VLDALRAETPHFFADFEVYPAEDGEQAARVVYHKI